MGSKPVEKTYFANKRTEECCSLVKTALNELGLKNLRIKKEVPREYLLVEYSPARFEKKRSNLHSRRG